MITNEKQFIEDIKVIVNNGRQKAYNAINNAIIETYWQIGKRIVEHEQQGKEHAEYGKKVLQMLSEELTKEFGKGFSTKSIYYYRQFYFTFPEKFPTVWGKLTWSHCKRLLSVSDEKTTIHNYLPQNTSLIFLLKNNFALK